MPDKKLRLLVEFMPKKTFASALDWPGWSRSGKTESDAIETLLAYADRYRAVTDLAELVLPGSFEVDVVDRLPGEMTTEFGVPSHIHQVERDSVEKSEIEHQLAVLKASWKHFDDVRKTVTAELRKGPRGGGRDRDRIVDHVIQSDRGYARHIDVRSPTFDSFDEKAVEQHHRAVFSAIPPLHEGLPEGAKGWPVRYAIRRMAWHILDHIWEMQDKDLTPKESK